MKLKDTKPDKQISVAEFAKKYGLSRAEAERLYKISGPSELRLDLLMEAKGVKPISP